MTDVCLYRKIDIELRRKAEEESHKYDTFLSKVSSIRKIFLIRKNIINYFIRYNRRR